MLVGFVNVMVWQTCVVVFQVTLHPQLHAHICRLSSCYPPTHACIHTQIVLVFSFRVAVQCFRVSGACSSRAGITNPFTLWLSQDRGTARYGS